MRSILVATDFSTRSDRAVRRASILAKQFDATLTLVHVVDDDRPPSLVATETREADSLLRGLVHALREMDGVSANHRIFAGDPFDGLLRAAAELEPDLMVLGPHRRQLLKDVFAGTTSERTIRGGRWPVLVANAVPAHDHRRALIATDFSNCSANAVRVAIKLGLYDAMAVIVMHAYDAPAEGLMYKASMTVDETKDYLMRERAHAEGEMLKFLRDTGVKSESRILKLIETSPEVAIVDCAHERHADLIIVGTRGRSSLEKVFIGSVTNGILLQPDIDVLVVPCQR